MAKKKLYIDLAITIICVLLIVKSTKFFLVLVAIGAVVWFWILDDYKRKEIKGKISELFNINR